MDKVEKTFVGFLFSLKNISTTLLVNFVTLAFYYILFRDGIDSFFIGKGWIVVVTIFITAIWIAFWFLSYRTFKAKKIEEATTK